MEASYNADNFDIIKEIVSSFEDGDKLVERAMKAIQNPELFTELRQIYGSYQDIAILFEKIIDTTNTIATASEAIHTHFVVARIHSK